MSFLVGPVAGALAAGGVYYGFSAMMYNKTERHCADLRTLSRRLTDASSSIPAPVSAADRIIHHPFTSLIKSRWNSQVESFYRSFGELDKTVIDWGKKALYGVEFTSKVQ